MVIRFLFKDTDLAFPIKDAKLRAILMDLGKQKPRNQQLT